MEKLADSGMLAAAIDLTTTEICDMMMGGAFPATEDRFGAIHPHAYCPMSGLVGALDMVNFGAPDTVPDRYREPQSSSSTIRQVTLMRTTAEKNTRAWAIGSPAGSTR